MSSPPRGQAIVPLNTTFTSPTPSSVETRDNGNSTRANAPDDNGKLLQYEARLPEKFKPGIYCSSPQFDHVCRSPTSLHTLNLTQREAYAMAELSEPNAVLAAFLSLRTSTATTATTTTKAAILPLEATSLSMLYTEHVYTAIGDHDMTTISLRPLEFGPLEPATFTEPQAERDSTARTTMRKVKSTRTGMSVKGPTMTMAGPNINNIRGVQCVVM